MFIIPILFSVYVMQICYKNKETLISHWMGFRFINSKIKCFFLEAETIH